MLAHGKRVSIEGKVLAFLATLAAKNSNDPSKIQHSLEDSYSHPKFSSSTIQQAGCVNEKKKTACQIALSILPSRLTEVKRPVG
jgi:predicted NAD/FAD-binding protein